LTLAAAAVAQEGAFEQTPPPDLELNDLPEAQTYEAPVRLTGIAQEMEKQREGRAGGGAQTGSGETQDGRSFTRILAQSTGALCVVLVLILVAYYLVNRLGARTPLLAGAKLGTIMGRVALSPKAYLYFVRTANRVLVVGWTPTSINRVAEYDATEFEDAVKGIDFQPLAEEPEPSPVLRSDFRATLAAQELEERSIELDAATLDVTEEDLTLDMNSLRGEIEQLRAYVRESSHGR
jgi:flagellar biogenesis protein FliO